MDKAGTARLFSGTCGRAAPACCLVAVLDAQGCLTEAGGVELQALLELEQGLSGAPLVGSVLAQL